MNASNSLTDELMGQLQGAPLQNMAQQLGMDTAQTEQAVSTALPVLLGALGGNNSGDQPQGAMDMLGGAGGGLAGMLGGMGGVGGMLGGLLGGGQASGGSGADILGQIFGGQHKEVESGVAQATGLGANAGQLLQMLAPIVMAFLAQRAQAGGQGQAMGAEAQQGAGVGGMLGGMLDQNGDGKLDVGDLMKLGAGFLGGRR